MIEAGEKQWTFPRERPGISIGREASQSLESMVHMAQREELTDRTLTEDSKLLTLSLSLLCVFLVSLEVLKSVVLSSTSFFPPPGRR